MATEMTAPKFEVGQIVQYIWASRQWTARITAVAGLVEDLRYEPLKRWDARWTYEIEFLADGDTMIAGEQQLRLVPNVISFPPPRREWAHVPGGTAA